MQQTSSVDRAEGSLQIHRRTEPVHGEAREPALQPSLQHPLVSHACGPLRRGSAAVAFPADLQLCGFRLPHTLYRQAQDFILNFGFQNSPHEVPFRRPQMQQALVAFPGDRVLGLRQIENYSAVFNDYSIARAGEEVFDGADQGFRSHAGIVSVDPLSRL